jgi:hypothetical protein
MKGIQKIKNQRRVQMKNRNGSQEKLVDGIGWGLFLILIGGLLFADNKGWINEHGWLYFAIGLGWCVTSSARTIVGNQSADW